MNFDDESLHRPPLVNWTPMDMYDARHFVAAATSTPFDLVTETEVWEYRIGHTSPTRHHDWEDVNRINQRERELEGVRPTTVNPDDHPEVDSRGVTSDDLFYGKDDDDKPF